MGNRRGIFNGFAIKLESKGGQEVLLADSLMVKDQMPFFQSITSIPNVTGCAQANA